QGNVNGPFKAFERPHGDKAPLAGDGTFDIGPGSGWDPLTAQDLQEARFQVGIGFGPSQNDPLDHLMAEFQLSVNEPSKGSLPGLYDPSPAFWSASSDPKNGPDPPITSGIVTLNGNGTTTVQCVPITCVGAIKQPAGAQQVPEPGSLALLIGSGV